MHPDQTYVSRAFPDNPFDTEGRLKRIATKVIDCDGEHVCEVQRNEVTIRQTVGGRQEIKAVFFEDDRTVQNLVFQKFTTRSGKPHKLSFSFSGNEIDVIRWLLEVINRASFEDSGKIRFADQQLRELFENEYDLIQFLHRNIDQLQRLDAVKYMTEYLEFCERKRQLEKFELLLEDPEYFNDLKAAEGVDKDEALWQNFFEKNPWIFGLGLSPIYLTSLPDRKLEQVVSGYSIAAEGKRADALMKTNGALSALCFVEIKTHKTPLLKPGTYRSGTWSVSPEVAGAVGQCHITVQSAMNNLRTRLELTDRMGNPTGDAMYLYQPRSFLVVGRLNEFMAEHGANEIQYRSFELFRRNLHSPEILTFDELFQRAKATVELGTPGNV